MVEALFEIDDDAACRAWAETVGLDALEDGELVVRREVLAEGSGRIRVNGSPCTVQMLRELAGGLIELHGQRDQQGLLVAARQLELLDRFAGNDARLERVGSAFAAVREAGEALSRLAEMERDRVERVDRLRRMIEAIEVLDPRPGELDELGRQRQVLRNAERMVELLDRAVALGHDDDPAAAGLAASVASRAEELAGLDPSLEDVARRLREAAVEIQDAVCALRDYRDGTDFDPRRLDQLEGRSAALERLCLEHGVDESGLVGRLAGAREELGCLEDLGAATEKARKDEGLALESYAAAAAALTRARRSAAGRLKPALEQQLSKLALERAAVSVELIGIRTTEDQAARAGPPLGARGAERAEFLRPAGSSVSDSRAGDFGDDSCTMTGATAETRTDRNDSTFRCVSTSNVRIESTSSPNSSMRTGSSAPGE